MLKRIMKSQKGFTLIELLIVVAILGILAVVVLPNVVGLIDQAKTTAAVVEVATVQTAADIYNVVKGMPLPAGAVELSKLAPYLRSTPAATYSIDANGKTTSP